MAFEELLNEVGGLGKFQILQMVFVLPPVMIAACHILLENFTAAIPGHRCWVPILDNDTVSDNDTGIFSPDVLLRIFIPLDSNLKPEKCHRFLLPQWQLLQLNGTFPNMTDLDTEPCVDGWVYDRSSFSSTIVTEWDLVCDHQSQKPVVQSLFMAGMLVGGLIYGHLSDRFGRKLILRWCLLQLAISGTCAAFAPTFLIYCSLRFWSGCSAVVIITNNWMLIVEWTRSQSKAMVITLITCAISIGQIMLGGLAFVFRDWHTLQLVVSIPFFVFFFSSRWLVESARWLIITNKPDKGLKELKKVAHRNGIKNAEAALNMEICKHNTRFWHLYQSTALWEQYFPVPGNLWSSHCLSPMSCTSSIELYGPSTNPDAFHVPGGTFHFDQHVCAPRAKALGLDVMASRCGSALAPLLMTLVVYLPTLPWIIYGVCPIIASLVVPFQPETRNLPLLDTIQDVENNKNFSREAHEKDFYIKVTKF
ncbi:solute carrier family 22 member 24-like isoform X2 [Phocoena sinus]|uniref:solute carrier family 22 member 24-like isoform X2 n=1 Tax=Phocoena sinus TaxID=42100 RepID=UPI0013C4EF63|nr:solute carrier family 22 member 24-like isoform X2 [Phocoena sinus]